MLRIPHDDELKLRSYVNYLMLLDALSSWLGRDVNNIAEFIAAYKSKLLAECTRDANVKPWCRSVYRETRALEEAQQTVLHFVCNYFPSLCREREEEEEV